MPAARGSRRLGAALQQAVGGRVSPPASGEERAPGAGLLANPSRGRIFQALLDRPLTHVAGLARSTALSPPSVRWHLRVLEQAGLVRAARGRREVRYFVTGTVEESTRGVLHALRGPLSFAILQASAQSPGLTLRELAEELGASPQSVLRAKAPLAALGFVESLRDGKFVRHYPGRELANFLARRAAALPSQLARVESALTLAGETVSITRRSREEVVFHVGRRGARREFRLRPDSVLARERGA